MPTWLKVLLVIAGLVFVLLVAAAVGTFYVVRRYGPALVEATKRYIEEGQQYGQQTDNEGCVNEAVARQARVHSVSDAYRNSLFVRACLESSRPTPGFCDGVPRQLEFVRAAQWQAQQCQRYGLGPERQCHQLFQQVQIFCESRRTARDRDAPGAR